MEWAGDQTASSSSADILHPCKKNMKRAISSGDVNDPVKSRRRSLPTRSKAKSKSCQQQVNNQRNVSLRRTSASINDIAPDVAKNSLPGPHYTFLDSKCLIGTLESLNESSKLLPCVPDGLKENTFFLVDNSVNARRNQMGLKGIYKDDSGPWNFNHSHSVTRYFLRSSGKSIELKDGIYCSETKRDKKRVYIPLIPQPSPELDVLTLHSHYVKHKSSESYKRRVTWFDDVPKDVPSIAFYEYCGVAPKSLKETLHVCSTEVYDDIYCLGLKENTCEESVDCVSVVINEYPHLKEAVGGHKLPDIPGTSLDIYAMMDVLKTVTQSEDILSQIPEGLKENVYFIVDAKESTQSHDLGKGIVFDDDSGPWDFGNGTDDSFYVSDSPRHLKYIELKDGVFFNAQSKGDLTASAPQPELDHMFSVRRYNVWHKLSKCYRKRITCLESMGKDLPCIAFIEYLGSAPEELKQELVSKSSSSHDENCVSLSHDDSSLASCQENPSAVVTPANGVFENEWPEVGTRSTFLPLHVILDKLRQKVSSTRSLAHVPTGLKENQHFVVNNSINVERHHKGRKCTFWDDSGQWTSHVTTTVTYLYENSKTMKKVVNQNGEYCTEHKVAGEKVCIPLVPQPNPDDIIVFHRNSAKHRESDKYRRRITWLEDGSEDLPHVACYEYCGSAPQCLVASLGNNLVGSLEVSCVSQGDNTPDRWIRCANGSFMLTHPGGKFLDLYEVISVLQMAGFDDEPLNTVPCGVKENQFFIVCNTANIERQIMGKNNVFWDDCGAWNANCTKVNTERYLCGANQKLTRVLDLQGELCIERCKDGNRMYIPLCPQPDPSTLLVIHRNFSKHSLSKSYQRKVTWLENSEKEFPKVACYEYLGKFPGHQPHGSCRKNYRNYVRNKESTFGEMKEAVLSSKSTDACQNPSEDTASSSYHDPEYVEQIIHFQDVETEKSKDAYVEIDIAAGESNDAIASMVYTHPFVQIVTSTKGKQISVVMYLDEQLLDLKRFCCYSESNEITVLGFSKIRDLCGLSLTFSIFKNLSVLRKNTNQNPIFPGPMLLHEESDHTSYVTFFTHLAAQLGEAFSQLVIVSEEEEMRKAFDQAFPNGLSLSSIQCIQRDLMNYLKEQRNIQAKKKNLIKELVFGEDGIIDAKDSVTFSYLVNKTQRLFDELPPNVGTYFKLRIIPQLKKNFDIMQKIDIPSSVLKWTGLNCNSFKHNLKVTMKCPAQSKQIKLLIKDLYLYVFVDYMDLKRSLISVGNFCLCQEFRKFSKAHVRWGDTEENLYEHFLNFLGEGKRRQGLPSSNISFCAPQMVQSEILEFMDED